MDYLALVMFPVLLVALFLGFPVAFSMMGVAIVFGYITFGDAVIFQFVQKVDAVASNFVLAAVPLFIFMGAMMERSGIAERLFEAVRGCGGTVRLLMLPFEGHGYRARESVEHVLWEQLEWFDRHVKNAPARERIVDPT